MVVGYRRGGIGEATDPVHGFSAYRRERADALRRLYEPGPEQREHCDDGELGRAQRMRGERLRVLATRCH
jgi:hypothetical protein